VENIDRLTGEDLIAELYRHFSYLAPDTKWDELLKAIFSKVISSKWNKENLEIIFPDNINLIATPGANKNSYADWPEYFQNMVAVHEQISFIKDNWGVHLGELANFEQGNMIGEIALYTKNGICLKAPLTDYSNWWIYNPDIKTVDGESVLSFVDHGVCDFGVQSAYRPGELFLIRMANELSIEVLPPPASEIATQEESNINTWWNNLDQEWKHLISNELNLAKGQVPNQKKIDGVDCIDVSKKSSVRTLEPLLSFKNLETVIIESNLVVDISPLKAIKKLEKLTIKRKTINDFDVLKELHQLKDLSLWCSNFNDLNLFSNMSELERLSINRAEFDSVEKLLPLKKLRFLIFNSWELKDITPLQELVNLESVSLRPIDNLKDEVIELVTKLPKCTVALGGKVISQHILNRGKKKPKDKDQN